MLPIQRIHLRLLMIIKHIYVNSKKNNMVYVYKLQRYLINCNEAKFFLIHKIFYNIRSYYTSCINVNAFLKQMNKYDLLKSLFVKCCKNCKISQAIIEQIKQNLIRISTEPVWKTKLVQNFNEFSNKEILDTIIYESKNIQSECFLSNTIIRKINCYTYAKKSINSWIYSSACLSLFKPYNKTYQRCFDIYTLKKAQASKSLSYLLSNIMFNDVQWYIFSYIKNDSYSFNKDQSIVMDRSKRTKTINELLIPFKAETHKILYRKTSIGFNVMNTFNTDKQILDKINHILNNYYCNLINFIPCRFIENCNKVVNYYLYIWIKRKTNIKLKSSNYIYNLKVINTKLNKLIYIYNIKNYYIS
uniref:Reverse transcriptase N-terminal domain-containing protein n=1 Tax=Polysiphonia sp. TaxID=1967842 RepID=A0A1Z1M3H9_9FLOR|nr:hypothetical protein [Polysiphonia sp.]